MPDEIDTRNVRDISITASDNGIAAGNIETLNVNIGGTNLQTLLPLLQQTGLFSSPVPIPSNDPLEIARLRRDYYNLFVIEDETYQDGSFAISRSDALTRYTSDARDLMRRLSALAFSMPSTSMVDTPRWSRILAISSFSLNESDISFIPMALRMVTSLIRISLMMVFTFLSFRHRESPGSLSYRIRCPMGALRATRWQTSFESWLTRWLQGVPCS